MDWSELYTRALAVTSAAAGNYNRNIALPTPDGKVNVRIPMADAPTMDVRLWREEDVLRALRPYVDRFPLLRHASDTPRFQVQQYIEGRLLDSFSPRGSAVPDHVVSDMVRLLGQLTEIPQENIPPLPNDWPLSGDSSGFGRRVAAFTRKLHLTYQAEYAGVFTSLGFPADPLASITPRWANLTPRPFALLHADLHRKNMIVAPGSVWFVDWELALWGDPAYEVAVHLYKMDYPEDQRDKFLCLWLSRLPSESTCGWEEDVPLYIQQQQIRSAIAQTVRYCQWLSSPDSTSASHDFLTARLAKQVNSARRAWGVPPDMSSQGVHAALLELPAYANRWR